MTCRTCELHSKAHLISFVIVESVIILMFDSKTTLKMLKGTTSGSITDPSVVVEPAFEA